MPSILRRTPARLIALQICSLVLLSAAALLAVGCGSFFSCEGKASCPATGTTGSTGTTGATGATGSTTDFAYVANSATGSTYLNGYNLSAGALTAITGSPFSLNYSPSSIAITPSNTFMYAATDSALYAGNLYGYSISSTGTLSILNSGTALTPGEDVSSLAISPDGNYLFCLDEDGLEVEEYSINTSTGALTFVTDGAITGASGSSPLPSEIAVAPSGDYIAVALGTGGLETFAFSTTTGLTPGTLLSPTSAAAGFYAVAIDGNNYLYGAGTAGLQVFSVTTAGIATQIGTYAIGNGPRSIAINSSSTYVYVGNETDSTISGYSIGTGGVLTALAGSPYTAPATVDAIAIDNTNAYVIASGYDATSGIQLFSIGSAGALTPSVSAATGTSSNIPGAIAATH